MKTVMKQCKWIVMGVIMTLGAGVMWSQTAASPQAAPAQTSTQAPLVSSTTEEVVLDVVARDKKGRSVADLKQDDFTVVDNGQKVVIKGFRRVEGAEAINGATGQRAQLDPLRQVRLLTLVFQYLDLNGRQIAKQAALDLVKGELPQNVYVSVITTGSRLDVIQPFTNDREMLKKAINRVTSGETEFKSDTDRIAQQMQNFVPAGGTGSLASQAANMSGTVTAGPGQSTNGGGAADAAMAQIMANILTFAQRSEKDMTGRSTIFSLLELVKQEKLLPGRKTILYFSPGFTVPQGMEEAFKNVMSTSNLANVSFYAIDSRGLNSTAVGAGKDELTNAVNASRAQTQRGAGAVTGDQARGIDSAINAMRADTQTTLQTLAEGTGGALVANSNDYRGALRRITEDIESYYEITYSPNITTYDGSLRKVNVQTDRSDIKLQSRSGYFALPPGAAMPGGTGTLAAYEVPLLEALNATPARKDFPHTAAGFHYLDQGKGNDTSVVIDVVLSNIDLTKDAASSRFKGQFSYMAVVKDQAGAVVKKFAGEIPLNFPADKVDAAKNSHFIYTEPANLPPGRYRLETAVMDMTNNKVSTRKSSFLVPPPDGKLAISSVSMVRSVKDNTSTNNADDPFVMGNKIVTPILAESVSKAATPGVPFYVVIYLDPKLTDKPELTMTFMRDGQTLGSGDAPLSPPDAHGRIQYIATAPAAQLEPGLYQIQFTAKQGGESAVETVSFTLAP